LDLDTVFHYILSFRVPVQYENAGTVSKEFQHIPFQILTPDEVRIGEDRLNCDGGDDEPSEKCTGSVKRTFMALDGNRIRLQVVEGRTRGDPDLYIRGAYVDAYGDRYTLLAKAAPPFQVVVELCMKQ
jgi:hypothetical protein